MCNGGKFERFGRCILSRSILMYLFPFIVKYVGEISKPAFKVSIKWDQKMGVSSLKINYYYYYYYYYY